VRTSKLFRKVLFLQVLLFGIVALAVSGIAGWSLYRNLSEQFRLSGIAIARNIADSAVDVLVNRDLSSLQSLVDQFAEGDGVSYVFVTDPTGDIVAHTFVPAVPAELQRIAREGQSDHVEKVRELEGVMDVSSPILGGRAGVVHVGMNRHTVTARIWGSIEQILAIFAGVLLVNVVLAFVVVQRISRPLLALADHAGTLATQGFTSTPPTQQEVESIAETSSDEVGQLTRSYLKMQKMMRDYVMQLEKSQAELEQYSQTLEQKVVDRTKTITEKNSELQAAMENLHAAQQQIITQEKMASLGELTAGIAHEIKNPLNFVNNFSALSLDLLGELRDELKDAASSGLTGEILTILGQNMSRINEQGKRADSIVQNMLLYSRGTSGELRPTDINALLDESVNLAYHGLRAKDVSFNITVERDYDASIGMIEAISQDLSRVFLNIVNNAYYSAYQKARNLGDSFSPTLRVSSHNLADACEIRIEDNGMGIPKTVTDKIFNPFFTTKPPGEGTGLGLSLSYETIVRGHRGEIRVETVEGEYAAFIIRLPKAVAAAKEVPTWPTRS
jgi:signal transduction histidine kinase